LHFDHPYFSFLVAIPFVSAAGLFMFGWFSLVRASIIYYSADLPLTYWERRKIVSMFTVSGEATALQNLTDAEKTALKYMPSLKIAWKRAMVGILAIFALFAFTALLLLFEIAK
jgi:hypothetical protein